MFKVGDKVRRNAASDWYTQDKTVRTVTEVFDNGWFNHDGGRAHDDYSPCGGCGPAYWELVEEPPAVGRMVINKPNLQQVARTNDPGTSQGKRKVNKYEQAVLDYLGPFGPGTGKEIASYMDQPLNCITPRFAPLRRKGRIKDSGERRDKQIVWVLA